MRLSLSQRLTGEVSNGDLARANFAGDYKPKLLRTETVDGRVAETGTHASLLARNGLYARLVSRQLASVYAPAAS